MKRFARDILFIYLAMLIAYWLFLFVAADRWWPATIALFAPQWLVATPLAILFPITLILRPQLSPLYLLHAGLIAVPIMGLQFDLQANESEREATELSVLTYNVGGGDIESTRLVQLIASSDADVVILQECAPALAEETFRTLGWNCRREGMLATGSRFPLGTSEVLARHEPDQHLAIAMLCSVECTDGESLTIVNVHLPTPRPGLLAIWESGVDGRHRLNEVTDYRMRASQNLSSLLNELPDSKLIAGDFNMPAASNIYRQSWRRYENAFDRKGTGLGYTKKTRWHGVRIDHVLCDDNWAVTYAEVKEELGGDHAPLFVELARSR